MLRQRCMYLNLTHFCLHFVSVIFLYVFVHDRLYVQDKFH